MLQNLSYILPHEVEEAKKLINDMLEFPPEELTKNTNHLAVKLYIREEDIVVTNIHGKEVRICIPEEVSIRDAFRTCTALVISQGSNCYKSERYKNIGPFCNVGDWICMPRNQGTQICYRDIPIQIIEEDKFYCVLESGAHIFRLNE